MTDRLQEITKQTITLNIGKAVLYPSMWIRNPEGHISFEAFSIIKDRIEKLEAIKLAAEEAVTYFTEHNDGYLVADLEKALSKLRGEDR